MALHGHTAAQRKRIKGRTKSASVKKQQQGRAKRNVKAKGRGR